MFERQSALSLALAKGGRDGPDGKRVCRVGEVRGWSLLQVAGFRQSMKNLETILTEQLGTEPPARIGAAIGVGERLLLRTGPEQIWILGPEKDEIEGELSAKIYAELGVLTPLSHSRTRIFIEGTGARDVLAKGIPIDLDPAIFGAGTFALTGLHHTPILLLCSSIDRYEIFAMRTFAVSVWEWLVDAAWPLGYEID